MQPADGPPPGREYVLASHEDLEEVAELGWFSLEAIGSLSRQPWIDRVLQDAARSAAHGTRAGDGAP